MFKRLFAAGLLFGMAATAPPAAAQGCAPRDLIVDRLKEGYAESLAGAGLQASADAMLELWSNPESGSFTVLLTRPDGLSCILSHGWDFRTIDRPAGPEGDMG